LAVLVLLSLRTFADGGSSRAAADSSSSMVAFAHGPGSVAITIGGAPFATFVYDDEKITRPYFALVHAPNGVQATRRHPPVAGSDPPDHPEFHPGIWLAFGDLNGSDGWRLKAPVEFTGFVERPHGGDGAGVFVAEFSHRQQRDPELEICRETMRCEVRAVPEGTLLLWEFAFGDQEEMGLGVRLATPLRAELVSKFALPAGGGEIVSADGNRNEREVWGTAPKWCDYRGVVDGQSAGIAILCHPENVRPSRFHVRDYGLMVANPFGQAAFDHGEPSRVIVTPGKALRLRYGVLVHGGVANDHVDIERAFERYVELADE
jgi:hypothetical protein